MAVEAGQVVRGTVVRLMNYGVLVRIEDGSTGLVHISEIDNNFVRDVADYFQVNDPVIVKVLAFGDRGKIELSVKQAVGQAPVAIEGVRDDGDGGDNNDDDNRVAQSPSEAAASRREARESFESKMSEYMRSSGERLADIKRNIELKRGGKKVR
jgi:S1 RNA binding domain protein